MLRNSLYPPLSSRQAYALQIFSLFPHHKTDHSPVSNLIPPFPQFYLQLPLNLWPGSMKFGKRLKHQIEQSLPGWRDYFLSYKELKKLLKLISSASPPLECGKAEADFVYLLNDEIDKFNSFFVEQEEDFIIHHKELQQRIKKVMENGTDQKDYKEELAKIRKDIVNFHGEMVLLMNYSNINYTGLAKILKKYDKRTGGVLRLPFIQKVLEQPFFTTDLISKLIKECENTLDSVFPPSESAAGTLSGEKEALALAGEGIFRNTVAALLTMQEMRRGSSTLSHFSLPPLKFPDSDIIHTLQILPPIQIP